MSSASPIIIGLNAVIVAVTDEVPRILAVKRTRHSLTVGSQSSRFDKAKRTDPKDALPFGPFDPHSDRTLELGLRRWVRDQAGLEVGYVEQLYTFGDRNRDPRERQGGPRVVSVAYLALVKESRLSGAGEAHWMDWYHFFPWEDWRTGPPSTLRDVIAPVLTRWTKCAGGRSTRQDRLERIDVSFGMKGAPWDGERVLERYELLYEAGLVAEAHRDGMRKSRSEGSTAKAGRSQAESGEIRELGKPMALDHRRILATALGRLRGKLKYRPVVFELLPFTFTLLQLQRVIEALAGCRLHKQNLRRLVEKTGLVEGTGHLDTKAGGRPAELFRFRRDVLRERPAPGVGLPGLKRSQ